MVLDTCQSLYEKHTLITYPRSDNRYLPNDHFSQAQDIINSVVANGVFSQEQLNTVNTTKKVRCFNDAKVAAHHAIVPTNKKTSAQLTNTERQIYELICRQYVMQFMPAYRYNQTDVEVDIAGGRFTTKAKEEIELGYKVLLPKKEDKEVQILPPLSVGEQVLCEDARRLDKNTTPPAHFTDATILAAMTAISRYVKDKDIRKVLRETDGLGTEATRASIIELLFKRGFLARSGKSIIATDAGVALINALPETLSTPDMTAHWEMALAQIAEKQLKYDDFMQPLVGQLGSLIEEAKSCDSAQFAHIKGQVKRKFKGARRKSPRPKSNKASA